MESLAALAGKSVYLDANVFIYALDDLAPWNTVAAAILGSAEAGEFLGITSELTLAECLVKPLQTGREDSARVYEQTIRPRRWLTVVPVSRDVLVEAARVRAVSGAKLPDSIHVASYRQMAADIFVTNDRLLKNASGLNVLLLSDVKVDQPG